MEFRSKTILGLIIAAAVTGTADTPQVFRGIITDSMCAMNHKMMNITPDDKCVRDCIKMDKSVKYVLFDGKTTYKLSDQKTPERFAAKKVKITGKLFEKTGIIQVQKIEAD